LDGIAQVCHAFDHDFVGYDVIGLALALRCLENTAHGNRRTKAQLGNVLIVCKVVLGDHLDIVVKCAVIQGEERDFFLVAVSANPAFDLYGLADQGFRLTVQFFYTCCGVLHGMIN
jgi:hypothetical protein